MKRILGTVIFSAIAVSSFSQSISSFNQVDQINGITTTLSGNTLNLNVSSTPTMMISSQLFHITEVFGVWSLDNDDDLVTTASAQNSWSAHTNFSGTGGIAGWKANPNSGITGTNLSFAYTTKTGTVENFGYHVRLAEQLQGGGNTLYIKASPVPEPTTLGAIALGVSALLRRRRKN